MHWTQKTLDELVKRNATDHSKLTAREDTERNHLKGSIDQVVLRIKELEGQENDPELLKETGFSSPPSPQVVDVKKRHLEVMRRTIIAGLILEAADAAFALTGVIDRWTFTWIVMYILFIVLLVYGVVMTGTAYRKAQDEGQKPNEVPATYRLRLFSLGFGHGAACVLMGSLTGYRLWKIFEIRRIEALEAGIENREDFFATLLPVAVALVAFWIGWALAKRVHEYGKLKVKWTPWIKLYDELRTKRFEEAMLRAQLESLPMEYQALHAGEDQQHENRLMKFSKQIERRGKIYEFFHKDTYPGRVILGQIASLRQSRGGGDSSSYSAIGLSILILGFALTVATPAWSQVTPPCPRTSEKRIVLSPDITYSMEHRISRLQLQDLVILPVVRSLPDDSRFLLIPIDAGSKATPQVVFEQTISQGEGLYGEESRFARIKLATILSEKYDSLMSIRDQEYRKKTQLLYTIMFVSEKVCPGDEIIIISDMIEESDLADMRRPFAGNRLLAKLKQLNLVPRLSGITVVVVTPPAKLREADMYVARKRFYEEYFRKSEATLLWFGADLVSAKSYFEKTRKENNP